MNLQHKLLGLWVLVGCGAPLEPPGQREQLAPPPRIVEMRIGDATKLYCQDRDGISAGPWDPSHFSGVSRARCRSDEVSQLTCVALIPLPKGGVSGKRRFVDVDSAWTTSESWASVRENYAATLSFFTVRDLEGSLGSFGVNLLGRGDGRREFEIPETYWGSEYLDLLAEFRCAGAADGAAWSWSVRRITMEGRDK